MIKKYKWLFIPISGNFFEWYEFAIFSTFAGIIGQLFFNNTDSFSATLSGFMIYGIAFIARPFGTLFFGYIGDRYGRKKALSASLFLMCFSTLSIPFLPLYSQIGVWSSILLAFVRVLQGISCGGEFSSVITYTCERANIGKKAFCSSLQSVAPFVATLFGVLTIMLLTNIYTNEQILNFGWKIPFFVSIIIGFIGLYARVFSTETEEFTAIKKENKIVKNPFLHFFRYYYKEFFICGTLILNVSMIGAVYILGVKMFFANIFHLLPSTSNQYALIILISAIFFTPLFGFFIDKFSIQKIRILYTLFLFIMSILSMYSIHNNWILTGSLLMSFGCVAGVALYPYYMYKHIPAEVRDTGAGFSICIPTVIGAGFSMVILMKLFQHYFISGIYIFTIAINVIALIGLLFDLKYSKIS